jgi:hypothetical protein
MGRSNSRGPGGRPSVAALLVLVGASLIGGQIAFAQEPPHVNPICAFAFDRAAERLAAASPTPDVAPDPDASPAPTADRTILDETIRVCAGLADWQAGLGLHPELLGDLDPMAFLEERCTNAGAGLEAYSTCVSLAIAFATPDPTPVPSPSPTPAPSTSPEPNGSTTRGAFLRQYCKVADDYTRRRQQNISLVFEVYDWQSSGLLPSTLLAKFLGGAAERSRSIARRMERVDPYAPMRELVRLQVRLLRDEGTMLRLYAEFAREPTDRKLALAEEAREERGDSSASVTLAMLDPAISDIGC